MPVPLPARLSAAAVLGFGLAFSHAPATAANGPYSAVVVFGDSLSDNGNLYALTGGAYPPSPAYYAGRFSNGPVAVEHLAAGLGAPLVDLAVGGATTGLFNGNFLPQQPGLGTTGLLSQLGGFATGLNGAPADANALYVVWAGANDFLHPTSLPPEASALIAVANLSQSVNALYDMGARHFLLPLLPDLGQTPRALGDADPTASPLATGLSLSFNQLLGQAYATLATSLTGATLTVFDTFANQHLLANTPGLFTNTGSACLFTPACAASPATAAGYMFWDDVHPTATTHAAFAQQMLAQLAPVPEPQTLLMMATGVLVLLGVSARRRVRQG